MNISKVNLVCLLLLILLQNVGFSQDLREQFERAKQGQLEGFEDYRAKNDSIFAKFIIDGWHEAKFENPFEKEGTQKPLSKPIFKEEEEMPSRSWENIAIDTIVYLKIDQPEQLESTAHYPELSQVRLSYAGAEINLRYPVELPKISGNGSEEKRLSDYWLKASETGYHVLIDDLLSIKETYMLPDYAFYLMVKSFVENSGAEEDDQVYQTWFLMSKAFYACKIGFSGGSPYLLLGVKGRIFDRPYFSEDQIRYYALGNVSAELYTYNSPEKGKLNPLDLRIKSPIDLPLLPENRQLTFDHSENSIEVKIFYNKNVAHLAEGFPTSDLSNYLSSSACLLLKKSLHKEFDARLEGLQQLDKVRFLLAFVQSMPYKKDHDQFGQERIFYPDEFLSHEYSDCEDRVVFLSYLIREFVDVDAVAITFPNHAALALHIETKVEGQHVVYEDKKYTICDPTYFGAPVGAVIPDADFERAKIVPIY